MYLNYVWYNIDNFYLLKTVTAKRVYSEIFIYARRTAVRK